MGPRDVTKLRLGSWVRRSGSFQNIHAAQVPVSQGPLTIVDKSFIQAAHNAEIQVHVWTIDDEEEMVRLLDLGVDGIMGGLNKRLIDNCQWPLANWHLRRVNILKTA